MLYFVLIFLSYTFQHQFYTICNAKVKLTFSWIFCF